MRINHNIAALNTYRQLTANNEIQNKSLAKLSSGLRINSAADDAAGLAITEKMRGQIRGLGQAQRNAQDAISMIQTAEGALNETHSILQRMRELATQAASDTNTSDDRAEIQNELNQLSSEINRIGNTTEFNTKSLLNGSSGSSVELGSGSTLTSASVTGTIDSSIEAGESKTYSVELTAAGTAEIEASRGLYELNATDTITTASAPGGTVAAKTVVAIDVGTATSINDLTGVAFKADSSGGDVAASDAVTTVNYYSDIAEFNDAVGALTDATTAAVFADGSDQVLVAVGAAVSDATNDNFAVLTKNYDSGEGDLDLSTQFDNDALFGSGWGGGTIDITVGGESVNVTVDATDTLSDFISNVNSALETNDLNATLSYNATNANLVFTATEVGTDNGITITENFGGRSLNIADSTNGGGTGATDAVDVGWTVTDTTDGTSESYTSASGRSISATNSGISGVALTFSSTTGTQDVTVENGNLTMQIGSNAQQQFETSFSDMRGVAIEVSSTTSAGTLTTSDGLTAHFTSTQTVDNDGSTCEYSLDVSTADKATAAISAVDDAITAVSSERSKLGAYQNRLEHTINNLGTSSENLSAAESRVRDVDMAKEMMEFTKTSILSQAAQAMLAQANQMPQGVLQLLR